MEIDIREVFDDIDDEEELEDAIDENTTKENLAKSLFYKTSEFERTQRHWYAKLKKEGFDDIEPVENTPYLKDHHLRSLKACNRSERTRAEEFYRFAGQFYWLYTFKNSWHKRVWKLFSTGSTERQIVKILAKSSIKKYRKSRFPVNQSIKKTTAAMLEWIRSKEDDCN